MRVGLLIAGCLLASASVSVTSAATVTMSPPPAKIQPQYQVKVQPKVQAKAACPCDCPDQKVQHHAQARPRHMVRRAMHAASGYYSYASAAPLFRREWHGPWRAAPNDAFIPGPGAYDGPPSGYGEEAQVDDRNLTGGVGTAPDGGGGGGFTDGFGQIHFANGGSVENGPTYNDYNQSFQFNPSQAGPFQPRLMGGFAPRK